MFYFYISIDLTQLIYGCAGVGTFGGQRGGRLLGGAGQSFGNDYIRLGNVPLQKTKPVLIAGADCICIIHTAPCGAPVLSRGVNAEFPGAQLVPGKCY